MAANMADTEPEEFILALDIGSSSVRCLAYRLSADEQPLECHCSTARPLQALYPKTGKIYCESLFEAVDVCVDECLQQLRQSTCHEGAVGCPVGGAGLSDSPPFRVVAVGMSSFVMNLIGVSAQGEWISDLLTLSYACNTEEVAKEVLQLQRELGPDGCRAIHQETGAPIHTAYAIAQLRHLFKTSPIASQSVVKFTTISGLCLSRWTLQKHLPMSFSEASWTGLMSFRTCTYHELLLKLLPKKCVEALPILVDFDEPATKAPDIPMYSPYYARWPELCSDTKWFLGIGDGACANIGSKCTIPQRIACTIGTSAAARITIPWPIYGGIKRHSYSPLAVPDGLFCYRINRDYLVMGGALTDGGSVVDWLSQLFDIPRHSDALERCMAEVEDLVEEDFENNTPKIGLVAVPFLSGERSTGYRRSATGAIVGLTRTTTRAHLFKACLEGVTLRLNAIIDLIQKAYPEEMAAEPRIFASGKALEDNILWRQMISDCTALSVILDNETLEATSRGLVILILRSLSVLRSNSTSAERLCLPLEIVQAAIECRPRSRAKAYWQQASSAQDDFLNAVFPL